MSVPSSTYNTISVNTDGKGIGMFFGPLESEILEYLWSVYPRAVVATAVQKYLRNIDHNISPNTINSTLSKLRLKGMVKIQGELKKGPGGNLHMATCSRIDFLAHAFTKLQESVNREFPHEWTIAKGE